MKKKTTKDPRAGWTSASNAEADSLCPGRYLAQRGLPEESSALSKFGSDTHTAFAGEEIDLTVSQERILEMAEEIEADVLKQVFGDEKYVAFSEERYWAEFDGLKHSGQCDKVFAGETKVLIEDLKSLRGDVAVSSKNLQLRDEVALVWQEIKTPVVIYAFINQPLVSRRPVIVCYDNDDCGMAWSELQVRVKASHDPNAKRVAGTVQCLHCRARGVCPEAIRWAKTSSAMMLPRDPKQLVRQLTPEQCAQIWDKRKTLYAILDGIEQRLMKLSEKRLRKLGLEVNPGHMRETIVRPNELFERLSKYKIGVNAFTGIVRVPKSGVEKLLRVATGKTGKELDTLVDCIVDGLTESKQTAPTLTAIKG